MKKVEIEIPQNIVDHLQRSAMEASSRQGVIDRYFEKHMNDGNSDALDAAPFKHFMSLLAEAETEFEMMKEEVTKTYVPEYLQGHDVEWSLDYSTGIMEIVIKCDCTIPELDKE